MGGNAWCTGRISNPSNNLDHRSTWVSKWTWKIHPNNAVILLWDNRKMIIFKIYANLVGNVRFFYNILGHLKLPQLYPSDQRPEVWWLWLHRCFGWHELEKHLAVMENATMLCPPFLWKLPWKKNFQERNISRCASLVCCSLKRPFGQLVANGIRFWWVSPFSPHSDSGSVLFFLVKRWQDLGDGSSNSCKPPANQRKTSGFPTIFYLNPQSSQIKKVQEAWHHICDGKGRMTSRININ